MSTCLSSVHDQYFPCLHCLPVYLSIRDDDVSHFLPIVPISDPAFTFRPVPNSYVYLGRGAPQLAEGVRESVKNLMLVMSASGVFDAAQYETGGELWELAWAVIDAFYPELRAEMWPSQQPQQPPTDGSGSGGGGIQA